jgi:hypothetical protein
MHLSDTGEKNGNIRDFKKAYDLLRREVLYSILLELLVPMKLNRLIRMCLNETIRKVWIGKCLFHTVPIQNGLNQGDVLSPLLFNFAVVQAIRKVQKN